MSAVFALLCCTVVARSQLVVIRVPIEPDTADATEILMDLQTRQVRLGLLLQQIQKSARKMGAETDAQYDSWSADKFVMNLSCPKADAVASMIERELHKANWRGKVFMTERYGAVGARKALFVIKPGHDRLMA